MGMFGRLFIFFFCVGAGNGQTWLWAEYRAGLGQTQDCLGDNYFTLELTAWFLQAGSVTPRRCPAGQECWASNYFFAFEDR
jgi:hypothetical protein